MTEYLRRECMQIAWLLLLVMFTSCATIKSGKMYHLPIDAAQPGSKIEVNNEVYTLPATVKVERSKKNLAIKLLSDTSFSVVEVRSSPSPTFLYGNLIWIYAAPVAYLIDLTNQKRFYYGNSIYLDFKDSTKVIPSPLRQGFENYFSKTYAKKRGHINLTLSIPYINNFYLQPEQEEKKKNTGFWGISTGLEYFYQSNSYLGLYAKSAIDLFAPVPGAIDYEGEHEIMSSTYLDLVHNHKYKRINIGYGINFAQNKWTLRNYGPPNPQSSGIDHVSKASRAFGYTLNSYYQLTNHFFVGVVYRPTILRVKPQAEFRYEHLISLDLAWKIHLRK